MCGCGCPWTCRRTDFNEQELAKFSTQLVRARQGELQGQLMQALREKAQIEINTSFINQDDSEEGAAH